MAASKTARRWIAAIVLAVSAARGAAGLKVLDKPLWVFPGQAFRIAIEQPAGAGKLDVAAPASVKLYDTWPKRAIQRFYFRALRPGRAELAFRGSAGEVRVAVEVIPWSDVYAPRTFRKVALPRIWPLGERDYAHLKKRRTYYRDADVQAMRRPKARVHATARRWLAMSDEQVWNIIPGPCVPRTCLMVLGGRGREDGRGKGCPVCGMKVYDGRSGFYPWIFDAKNHPWKVGCPNCKRWFPSNDWQAGDMHSGDFPDDGFGCEPVRPVRSADGTPWRWPFIAYYHQWQAYMRELTPGIERCAQAFAQTGDRRYAHKAAVGLLRYAESLLDMSLNLNHRKMAVRDAILRWPVGAPAPRASPRHTFLYIQPNWDTPRMEQMARAWELILDALDGDAELLAFCRRHHHPEIGSADDLRRFVEAGVLRVPIQACLDDAVSRNFPMQEVALGTLGLVLDTPRSLDLVDWLLHDGAHLRFTLSNDFFKDGSAYESEGYNGIHVRDMTRMFDLLERFRGLYGEAWKKRRLVSPADDPKYRLMYDFVLENRLIGCTIPSTGDTGHPTTAERKVRATWPLAPRDFVGPYRATRDGRFARAMADHDGKMPPELREADLRTQAEEFVRRHGREAKLPSSLLDGYGHVILRSGSGDRQRALWLRYGRIRQHAHQDLLSIGLAALRRDMLPEIGYPQGWTYHGQWAANWGTHYGTHITGVATRNFPPGRVTLFADTPPARVASAETSWPADKPTATRARTIVLVDLPDRDAYAVTLERVRGGREHTLSFHGPDGEATPVGLKLTGQKGGTVLAPDAGYGYYSSVEKTDRELACLAFLYDVRRARPTGAWGLDYRLKGQKGVGLRMAMLAPPGGEVSIAKGRPPQGKKAYEMTWAIVRRRGPAPLASAFLTVLEPYEGRRLIRKVERVAVEPPGQGASAAVAVRIATGGFVDTLIFQPPGAPTGRTADGLVCDAEFGFWRERGGKAVSAVLAGGRTLGKGGASLALPAAAYRGRVRSCDWPRRTLIVEPRPRDAAALVGRHVRIHNDAGSDAAYLIEAAAAVDGGARLTLPIDPRIGEGFVARCEAGKVVSATRLRFAAYWHYYAGKTIANEDASAAYRLRDVTGAVSCLLAPAGGSAAAADRLRAAFADADADGRARFVIYDYGPGDDVTVKHSAALRGAPYASPGGGTFGRPEGPPRACRPAAVVQPCVSPEWDEGV